MQQRLLDTCVNSSCSQQAPYYQQLRMCNAVTLAAPATTSGSPKRRRQSKASPCSGAKKLKPSPTRAPATPRHAQQRKAAQLPPAACGYAAAGSRLDAAAAELCRVQVQAAGSPDASARSTNGGYSHMNLLSLPDLDLWASQEAWGDDFLPASPLTHVDFLTDADMAALRDLATTPELLLCP
ncbi:hypothetical protein D9Q98_003195 [Chlorella vulgaris]|uniref:Uncharacterized protein n=2 Tax=Chlorella vulgaris TaxID=3077 RepID=A0A9D4TS45_CHLVU|nr:hypothetical protein D9Q98_003195 [Chlorella vulgaris]